MSDNKINSGVSTSCCSEGPPSGHQLMTLLIKTAGGRESVMVHLGRGNLIPERSGDRYPTEFNFESLRSFRGQSSEDAIVDRRRLY
jgi:hypothetical protein